MKIRNHVGGHMSYLDDATRIAQLADMKDFHANTLTLRGAADLGPERRALEAGPVIAIDRTRTPQKPGSVAPTNEPAFQAPLRDPWVPPQTMRAQ